MKKRNPKLTSWLVGAVFLASCGEPGTPTAPVAIPISTDMAMLLSTPTNGPTACRNGFAGGYPCSGVDLVSMLDREAIGAINGNVNDMWGWTDPQTGTEWALVGHSRGTSFVGLSDPEAPLYAGILPLTPGARPSIWRDLKVYRDHVFIVSDAAGQHGMQVFDLRQLRNVANPPVTFEPSFLYRQIHSAHNIVINEGTGFAYSVGGSAGGETCGGGLHMIDVSTPLAPRFAGCFADPSTGNVGTGYTHDAMCVIYRGPHARYRGREICFASNETALSIADVTDKSRPVALSVATYPNVGYAHQAWLDDAHQFLYMNDEGDERGPGSRTRTIVWDVTSLESHRCHRVPGDNRGHGPQSVHRRRPHVPIQLRSRAAHREHRGPGASLRNRVLRRGARPRRARGHVEQLPVLCQRRDRRDSVRSRSVFCQGAGQVRAGAGRVAGRRGTGGVDRGPGRRRALYPGPGGRGRGGQAHVNLTFLRFLDHQVGVAAGRPEPEAPTPAPRSHWLPAGRRP